MGYPFFSFAGLVLVPFSGKTFTRLILPHLKSLGKQKFNALISPPKNKIVLRTLTDLISHVSFSNQALSGIKDILCLTQSELLMEKWACSVPTKRNSVPFRKIEGGIDNR